MSERPPPPTVDELEKALPMLFHTAHQCAAWHYWHLLIASAVSAHPDPTVRAPVTQMQNGIAEATVMFVRKSVEFFKPKGGNDRVDTLYSYQYAGYRGQEWIVPPEVYTEMHKRIGHLTLVPIRVGEVEWPMFPLAMQAMNKWAAFFEVLAGIPAPHNPQRAEVCSGYTSAIRRLISRMHQDVKRQPELGRGEEL